MCGHLRRVRVPEERLEHVAVERAVPLQRRGGHRQRAAAAVLHAERDRPEAAGGGGAHGRRQAHQVGAPGARAAQTRETVAAVRAARLQNVQLLRFAAAHLDVLRAREFRSSAIIKI